MLVRDTLEAILLYLSVLTYAIFWLWAIIHAVQTPRADSSQKMLWGLAIVLNPITAIYYWYVWKKKAFWALFTPILGFFFSLPLVARIVLGRANATAFTNALFALGSSRQVIVIAFLIIFPIVLTLIALLHLGRNTQLTAMDRNDWIVSLSLPLFGFGAGIAYCARYRRRWAIAGILWSLVMVAALKTVTVNISHALIPVGEEKREEFRLRAQ